MSSHQKQNSALLLSLQATIRATNATCGAVLSFWDPESATLSSVEMLDNINNNSSLTGSPLSYQHQQPRVNSSSFSSSSPKNNTNLMAASTSFLSPNTIVKRQQQQTKEKENNEEDEQKEDLTNVSFSSPVAMATLESSTDCDSMKNKNNSAQEESGDHQQQQQQDTTTTMIKANKKGFNVGFNTENTGTNLASDELFESTFLSSPIALQGTESAAAPSSMRNRNKFNQASFGNNQQKKTDIPSSSFIANKLSQARAQAVANRSTAQFAYSFRCVAVSSMMMDNSCSTTATTIADSQQNREGKKSSTAAGTFSTAFAANLASDSMKARQNNNKSLDDNTNDSNNKNTHIFQQRQVFQAAHGILLNKALSASVIQTVAKSGIAVHSTSPTAPYLVIPIIARKIAVEDVYSAASKRYLEADYGGGNGEKSIDPQSVVVGILVLVGRPVVDEVAEEKAKAVLEGRVLMNNNNNDSADGTVKTKMTVEQAIDTFSSKRVSFRAEEETIAVTLARTVFAEILSAPEGLVASDVNLNVYFSNLLSMSTTSAPQEKNSSSSNAQLQKNNSKRNKTPNTTKGTFRKAASSIRLSNRLSNNKNSNNEQQQEQQQDPSSTLLTATNNNNNIKQDSHMTTTPNTTTTTPSTSITNQPDFHRSTMQRRIPQIIRIPDSTIFLSQRAILKENHPDEFQALPDLPEVKKTIEAAEEALASLREENMNFYNIMNRKTNDEIFVGGGGENNNNNNNNNNKQLRSSSAVTIQEGMEKLEKRIAALRHENISLRNHIEVLNHRLESVLSKRSIHSVAQSQVFGRMMMDIEADTTDTIASNFDDSYYSRSNTNNSQHQEQAVMKTKLGDLLKRIELLDSSSSSSSSTKFSSVPRPPSSSFTARPSSSASTSTTHQRLIRKPSDVLSRPLPASVLLENKAISGLDKLKREVASRTGTRKANS